MGGGIIFVGDVIFVGGSVIFVGGEGNHVNVMTRQNIPP